MMTKREMRRIRLAAPLTGKPEYEAMMGPVTSGWLTQGPLTVEFETAFSQFHGGRHAVATSSGTTALHLAMLVLDVGPGDEVIVPSFTWVATANAVSYTGAMPVFADVELSTYNATAAQIAECVSDRTKAVLVVHQFGQCSDVDRIADILPGHVTVVEDSATAIGARLRGRLAGTLADLAAFSFHPRKILTTGEGGMLLSASESLAESARTLRNHGVEPAMSAEVVRLGSIRELGFNYRLTEMQAAIGAVQLSRLESMIEDRRRWASWYLEQLASIEWLVLPQVADDCEPVWQAFVAVVDPDAPMNRDKLAVFLAQQGIETRPGTHSVAHLDLYRNTASDCPNSSFLEQHSLAIPLHNRMTEADYTYVVETLQSVS